MPHHIGVLESGEPSIVSAASAGHELSIANCAGGICAELEVGGMPIRIMGGVSYPQSTGAICPGDTIIMATDGITEARAKASVLFGKDILVELVCGSGEVSPDEMASGILNAATEHVDGQLQDDAAVVVISSTP